jgi:hypothetical protein
MQDQGIAIVFDFVKPIRAGRHFGPPRWDAGLILKSTQHADQIVRTPLNASPKPPGHAPGVSLPVSRPRQIHWLENLQPLRVTS